ncbi:MAG: penicillin acylase family protein [Acidobacteria bacterium]|nr:penicillin acylase family protein [Acidobacteriota bacterium]
MKSFRLLLAAFLLFTISSGTHAQKPDARAEKWARSVTIYRDTYGVPHIFGKTDAACIFGLMYAQSEDNFLQLEDDYIRAIGRASEIHGERSLQGDLAHRAFEVNRLAQEEYKHLDADTRELLDAFAAGINYFLATHPGVTPRLIAHFEPWFPLAFERGASPGSLTRAGLKPEEIRLATPVNGGSAAPTQEQLAEMRAALESEDPTQVGSNMWAVSPAKSTSGHSLLLINPHVGFFGGGQRYEAHLHSKQRLDVSGFAILGTPYIRTGFNSHFGWSSTNNYADTVDAYLLTFDDPANPLAYLYGSGHRTAVEWTESVRVKTDKGIEERAFTFRKSHYGPIVGKRDDKAIAVREARMEDGGQSSQRFATDRAHNLEEFKRSGNRMAGLPRIQ